MEELIAMNTYGFIGVGNMGGALARAVCRKFPRETLLSGRTSARAESLAKELGCRASDAHTVAESCRYIFLGVKPQTMPELLSDLSPVFAARIKRGERFVLVSMAAGLTMNTISALSGGVPVIRIMPNTPVAVGAGMTLACADPSVTEEEFSELLSALEYAGRTDRIDEREMDAASVVAGCSPAYMFRFVKALADAGTALGLSAEKALTYAEQSMFGAAKLALETGTPPDELETAVCSPGGSTIEGIKSFERAELDRIVKEAASASYRRTKELAGK